MKHQSHRMMKFTQCHRSQSRAEIWTQPLCNFAFKVSLLIHSLEIPMQDWHGRLWEILTPTKYLTLDTWHFQTHPACHLFVECPSLWLLQLSSTACSQGTALTTSAAILCNSITACYPGPSKKALRWPPFGVQSWFPSPWHSPQLTSILVCTICIAPPTWYTPLIGSFHVVLHWRTKS